jgi:hypothetical protein
MKSPAEPTDLTQNSSVNTGYCNTSRTRATCAVIQTINESENCVIHKEKHNYSI